MTSFKRDVGASESGPRLTTLKRPRWVEQELSKEPEVPMMGMIWQDEIRKDRKRREWAAFYAGCAVGAAVLSLSFLFIIKLTGGWCP